MPHPTVITRTNIPGIPRGRAAFTLMELLVAVAAVALAGGAIFTLASSWNILYSKNFSINDTHLSVRRAADKITRELETSINSPSMLDNLGAKTSGNFGLGVTYSALVPVPGTNAGTYKTSTVTRAFWIVQTDPTTAKSELRYYANGFSPAGTNYVVLTRQLVAPTDMLSVIGDYPFQYTSTRSTQRCVDLNLKARAAQFDRFLSGRSAGGGSDVSGKFENFNTFFQVRSVVAYRTNTDPQPSSTP